MSKKYLLYPEHIEEIYNYCQTHTLEESKKHILPDVSKYEGHVLVICSYKPYYGTEMREGTLLKVDMWNNILSAWNSKPRGELYLGSIAGKHSEEYVELEKFIDEEITNPYDIYKEVEINNLDFGALDSRMLDKMDGDWMKICVECGCGTDIGEIYRTCLTCDNSVCDSCYTSKYECGECKICEECSKQGRECEC